MRNFTRAYSGVNNTLLSEYSITLDGVTVPLLGKNLNGFMSKESKGGKTRFLSLLKAGRDVRDQYVSNVSQILNLDIGNDKQGNITGTGKAYKEQKPVLTAKLNVPIPDSIEAYKTQATGQETMPEDEEYDPEMKAELMREGAKREQEQEMQQSKVAQFQQRQAEEFQKSQQYSRGGYVKGPSHKQGGVKVRAKLGADHVENIEIEGGEYVINKKSTQKFKPLLEKINRAGLSENKQAMRNLDKMRKKRKYPDGGELQPGSVVEEEEGEEEEEEEEEEEDEDEELNTNKEVVVDNKKYIKNKDEKGYYYSVNGKEKGKVYVLTAQGKKNSGRVYRQILKEIENRMSIKKTIEDFRIKEKAKLQVEQEKQKKYKQLSEFKQKQKEAAEKAKLKEDRKEVEDYLKSQKLEQPEKKKQNEEFTYKDKDGNLYIYTKKNPISGQLEFAYSYSQGGDKITKKNGKEYYDIISTLSPDKKPNEMNKQYMNKQTGSKPVPMPTASMPTTGSKPAPMPTAGGGPANMPTPSMPTANKPVPMPTPSMPTANKPVPTPTTGSRPAPMPTGKQPTLQELRRTQGAPKQGTIEPSAGTTGITGRLSRDDGKKDNSMYPDAVGRYFTTMDFTATLKYIKTKYSKRLEDSTIEKIKSLSHDIAQALGLKLKYTGNDRKILLEQLLQLITIETASKMQKGKATEKEPGNSKLMAMVDFTDIYGPGGQLDVGKMDQQYKNGGMVRKYQTGGGVNVDPESLSSAMLNNPENIESLGTGERITNNGKYANPKPQLNGAFSDFQNLGSVLPEEEGAVNVGETQFKRKTFNLSDAIYNSELNFSGRYAEKIRDPADLFNNNLAFRYKKNDKYCRRNIL